MRKFAIALVIIMILISLPSCNNKASQKQVQQPISNLSESSNSIPAQTSSGSSEELDESGLDSETAQTGKVDSIQNDSQPSENAQSKSEIHNGSSEVSIDVPAGLSNENIASWQPARNKEHKVPVLNSKYQAVLDKYEGYFVGDTSSKVIYLTFDEGYEAGYTDEILDILKNNDVKAAFFVVKSYIKKNPELVKRMVQEGHIVGNHSTTHPNMPKLYSEKGVDGIVKELTETADYFKYVTGYDMPKFFRPPEGAWSEATMYITNSMGYKTILWSMAHKDWDVNNQPPLGEASKFVDTYYHNGAILLLHPQSKTNVHDLEDIINNLKSKGYRFASLTELHK